MKSQQGTILATAMVLLLVLSLMSLAWLYRLKTMQVTTQQYAAELTAHANAHIGSRLAEASILQSASAPQASNTCQTEPPCMVWPTHALPGNLNTLSEAWWTHYAQALPPVSGNTALSLSGNRYVVEYLGSGPKPGTYYRVSARGLANNGTFAIEQSIILYPVTSPPPLQVLTPQP